MNLYPHQTEALDLIKDKNRCAVYYDMGLGKTYIGSEKMIQLGSKINLIICQKSKIDDWINHFRLFKNLLNIDSIVNIWIESGTIDTLKNIFTSNFFRFPVFYYSLPKDSFKYILSMPLEYASIQKDIAFSLLS